MTPFEELVLSDCLEDLESWRLLHNPTVTGVLNAEEFYDLCKAAGYGEETSQKAARQRAYERLKRDLPP